VDSNDPHEGNSSSEAEESGTRFIDSALGRSLNSSTLEYLISDDTVKRRRESNLPESPFPSAKRLHSDHHSPQQTSLQESPDRSNDNEFDTSLNKVGGLGNKINKRGALSSLEILTPKHEAHTAKSRTHTINQLCEKDYTVGWICALKTELDAAHKMLDEKHGEGLGHGSDNNYYILGKIGDHNVVLTCLPMGRYGNDNAAIVATQMINKFPNITIGLMVGIGGGLPNAKDDIRLGDVVVSKPDSLNGGILQYDKGKCTIDGFKCTGFLNAPPERLLAVLQRMPPHGSVLRKCSSLSYPGEEVDHLFKANYKHVGGNVCTSCDEHELVKRPPGNRKIGPCVFYGTIASGNDVIKDPATRDRLIKEHGALCFEMEAAGLLSSNFPCIVIRGVSDYADSHKNDEWQAYAAATAAQFAKDFIQATRSLNVMY
jgi:nucleoside phosphorylase